MDSLNTENFYHIGFVILKKVSVLKDPTTKYIT